MSAEAAPPTRLLLAPEQVNDVGIAVLTLAQEVWRLHDRQRALEAVLSRHGIDATAEIDAYQPDPDEAKRLKAEAEAFARLIVDALRGEPRPNPV